MTLPGRGGDLASLIVEVAWRLRSRGYRVSTAEIVKAVELAKSYEALVGRLTWEDLSSIIAASFTTARLGVEEVGELVKEATMEATLLDRAKRILSEIEEKIGEAGLHPGGRASLKHIVSGKSKKERRRAKSAYVILRKIGAIRDRNGRLRVADRRELERLAYRLAREGYESLYDALNSRAGKLSRDALLDYADAGFEFSRKAFESMSSERLLDAAEAALRKGEARLARMAAEELAARINRGEKIADPERAARILEKEGLLSPSTLRNLSLASGRPVRGMQADDIALIARSLGVEEGGKYLAKGLRGAPAESVKKIAEAIGIEYLWAIRDRRDPWLAAASNAARALREALLYVETGEEGRADMAHFYLDKSRSMIDDGDSRFDSIKRLVEAVDLLLDILDNGVAEGSSLDALLNRLALPESVIVLRGLYTRGGEWRRIAVTAMDKLLARVSSLEGSRLLPRKKVYLSPPGRLDVKRTIYRRMRWAYPYTAYKRRLRATPVVLALDASGSMLEYSSWSIAVASMFPRHLRRLIVFSHKVEVYDPPITRRMLAEILVSTSFQGYTNISAALRNARIPGVSRVVVITDLYQTVEDEPVADAALRLLRSGKKLVFIVPRKHDVDSRLRLESLGARVVVTPNARGAAREILRALLR